MNQEGKYTVIGEARNGNEAILKYRLLQPDLITMDTTMPVMGGIEAAQQIRSEFPDANIIMISSLSQKHMMLKALESGACNYVIKPITRNKVMGALEKIFECNSGN